MLIDTLANRALYSSLHDGIAQALSFLAEPATAALDPGRYPIQGEEIFAVIDNARGRGRDASPLEVHRRYIDVQYVIAGNEWMGWAPLADCQLDDKGFNDTRDLGFCREQPHCWFPVHPGSFTVFYPSDAHAPLAGSGEVRKIVVKVRV